MADPSDRVLLRCVRAAGGHAVILGVVCVLGAAAELLLPLALGRTVDAIFDGAPAAASWTLAAVVLVAVAAGTDVLAEFAGVAGTAKATAWVRQAVLRRIFAMPPQAAARRPVGDLVARLVGQAADAGSASGAVIGGLIAILPPAGSLVALALIDPWLGLAFVLGLGLMGVLMRGFVVSASTSARGYQQAQGVIAARLVEALGGARTIAAAGTTDLEIRRVLRTLPELGAHGTGTWTALATAAGRTAALGPLLQAGVIAVGGVLLTAGRLTPGELVAAIQYAALGAGLGAVLSTLNRLVRARAGADRAASVLAEPPIRYGDRPVPTGPGTLTLTGVGVRIDDRHVLRQVTMTVPGGATVAVVGRSGSGKSVLAEVAGRLRDPDEGTVALDGVPLPALARDALARAVGYGFERPALVGATIGDAIAMGRPGADPAFLRAAAAVATIDAHIARLPAGFATPLAAAPMSGGEAQRLGLARALAGVRVLVLDDASSSVDSVTEARIRTALTRHARGRTCLVVTHRRATAAAADLVAWLEDGTLRALAPHAALWSDPAYRAVFGAPAPAVPGPAADSGIPAMWAAR